MVAERFLALEDGDDSHGAATVVALTYREEGLEGVNAIKTVSWSLGNEFAPLFIALAFGEQTKVSRLFVRDLEPPGRCVRINEVFDAVLDAVATFLEQRERISRSIGFQISDFGRRRGADVDDHDRVIATATD